MLINPRTVIKNGAVIIKNNKINFAGNFNEIDKSQQQSITDLGNAAIVPGLINAHTHLELTHLDGRIDFTGSFADWISKIIQAKKAWTVQDSTLSVRAGIKKCIEAGTTTIADVTRNGFSLSELQKCTLRKFVFCEVINFDPSQAEETVIDFKSRIKGTNEDHLLEVGIFPHSPYTVSKELYTQCGKISDDLKILFSTHICETDEEIEFLMKGTGNLADLLRNLNMLKGWIAPGLKPIAYLNNLGLLKDNLLLVHCNYVSQEEFMMVEKSKGHVVFCPKSHRYFHHKNYPFQEFVTHNINMALGTDSLASNDSLSILDEMKYLYDEENALEPEDIFSMGTVGGATALGLEERIGKLEPGFDADITVIQLPEDVNGNFFENFFSPEAQCIFSVVSGSVCFDKYGLYNPL
ncbi:MAG: metal-dependent hydrolase [Candidatus Scalindua sp.]|nr:amidohydrolase family protein [Planctomycetota bacterium]GJQ60033.1 MAG: metal-dependent hydrolase [Candidatus Scalindua sp.]